VRKKVTDSDWEALGHTEPYFGVLTDQSYAGPSIDDEAVEAFMTTGRAYFDELLHSLDAYGLRTDWERSLDFGCGVGRVTIPIAERSASTVGVDVSRGMLFEAKRNLIRAGVVSAAALVQASDHLCLKNEGFDFVHSYIVLQHIHPSRGLLVLGQLASCLRDGGVGAVQLTYRDPLTSAQRLRYLLYQHVPHLWSAKEATLRVLSRGTATRPSGWNRGRGYGPERRMQPRPLIRMHNYDVGAALDVLRASGCHRIGLRFTDHAGFAGVILLFSKTEQRPL
jgi:SAM-dependent methyltransferase